MKRSSRRRLTVIATGFADERPDASAGAAKTPAAAAAPIAPAAAPAPVAVAPAAVEAPVAAPVETPDPAPAPAAAPKKIEGTDIDEDDPFADIFKIFQSR